MKKVLKILNVLGVYFQIFRLVYFFFARLKFLDIFPVSYIAIVLVNLAWVWLFCWTYKRWFTNSNDLKNLFYRWARALSEMLISKHKISRKYYLYYFFVTLLFNGFKQYIHTDSQFREPAVEIFVNTSALIALGIYIFSKKEGKKLKSKGEEK